MKASRDSIKVTGPDGPVVREKEAFAPFNSLDLGNTFTPDFGCPSTTRVRVTAVGGLSSGKVSGVIRFVYAPPDLVELKMSGDDTLRLEEDDDVRHGETPVAIRDLLPIDPDALIIGSGIFGIRAKWHLDSLFNAGFLHPILSVRLHRPDGTIVARQSGFSQHLSDYDIQHAVALDDQTAALVVSLYYGGMHAVSLLLAGAAIMLGLAMRRGIFGAGVGVVGVVAGAAQIVVAYPWLVSPVLVLILQAILAVWFVLVGLRLAWFPRRPARAANNREASVEHPKVVDAKA